MTSVNSVNGSGGSTTNTQVQTLRAAEKVNTINGSFEKKQMPGDIKELLKVMKQIMRFVEYVMELDEKTKKNPNNSTNPDDNNPSNAVFNAAGSGILSMEVLSGDFGDLLQQYKGALNQAGILASPPPVVV